MISRVAASYLNPAGSWTFDPIRCAGCATCVSACPQKLLTIPLGEVGPEKAAGAGDCPGKCFICSEGCPGRYLRCPRYPLG